MYLIELTDDSGELVELERVVSWLDLMRNLREWRERIDAGLTVTVTRSEE